MSASLQSGRMNQKQRTRAAIVRAARDLVASGEEVTMAAVARAALVSEATAYRYFPDLASLLREVFSELWPSPAEVMEPVADVADPVARIGFATEYLLREVLAHEGAIRAMIAASITKRDAAATRPGRRFGLIDHALAPLTDTFAVAHPEAFAQLKRDLALVVSAEAVFTLIDLCELPPDDAIASATHTATTLVQAAVVGRRSPAEHER
jgi:AcrR family transcriptional regulator